MTDQVQALAQALMVRAKTEAALQKFMVAAQAIGWPRDREIDVYNQAVIAAHLAHLEAEGMVVVSADRTSPGRLIIDRKFSKSL